MLSASFLCVYCRLLLYLKDIFLVNSVAYATPQKKSRCDTEEMQYLHCTWHLNPPLEKLLFHVFVHYAAAVSFLVAKSHFRLLQKPFCRPHSILLLPCHSAMKDWTPFSPGYLLLHINHLEVFFR